MIYIINKTLTFSSELKRLSLYLDNESYIILSNQAARLIVELIQKNGITLSREHLLKHVWEDYGSTPSNNNLYMAISEIRKAFRNLGVTDKIISTIPKTGFLFEAEIDVSQETRTASFNVSSQPDTLLPAVPGKKHLPKMRLSGLILACTILTLSVILILIYKRDPMRINKSYISPQFSLGKCKFFPLDKQNDEGRKWVTSFVQSDQVKSNLNIDCNRTETAVYYSKTLPPLNETFLSFCSGNIAAGKGKCQTLRAKND